MPVKIAINGLGRIGRSVTRIAMEKGIEIVAVNDLMPIEVAVYLLQWDSVRGAFPVPVEKVGEDKIRLGEQIVRYSSAPTPGEIDFSGADLVIEATGRFLTSQLARPHLRNGVKRVILSAPAQDEVTSTYVLGVNHREYRGEEIISNGSCTTNCLAPIAKILDTHWGIKAGFMTTIHSYTMDQKLLDAPNLRDIRRSRAAAVNIIPTFTGAAKAIYRVLPQLKGKLDGRSVRVPTPNVSLMDLVVELETEATAQGINRKLEEYSRGEMAGILELDTQFKVSSDINGNPASSIVAVDLTQANGNLVKLFSWYDNEWGYANRLLEMGEFILGERG
ncbi:MAG: type I glyceraldehyde-3-phosphate dehydrogenase [Epsilonproteobacteria bacterium]|nr:type I glyceraldehyde-3-phosphate dehydrogenase [Campylobacterota bacterium]NPA89214.1 type I glyceraldehyde-3-phosphate dehydrogenase [Campylobacterota bacterium]